jgi:hypothetical protein
VANTLIKNCLFIPKFNFLLRTTPFWKFSNYVNSIDSSFKSSLERILNLCLTDLQWCQSTLLIRFGGLGIRRISINGVKKLVSLLLNSKDNELIIHHYDEAVWDIENKNERPTIPQFQKKWDNVNIKRIIKSLIQSETWLVLRLCNAENQDLGYMQYLDLLLILVLF